MCLSDGSRDSKLQEAQTPASVGLQESAGTEGHGAGAVAAQPRDRPSDSARCSASFQRTPATSSGRRLTTNWPSPSSTFLGLAVPTLPPRSLRTTPSLCSPSQRPRAAHVRLSHGGLSNHVSECARPHVCRVCPSCKGRIVLISSAELHLRGMGSTQCREEEGPRAWSNHPGTQLPRQEGVEGLVSGPCQRQGATGPFHRVFLYYYTNRPPQLLTCPHDPQRSPQELPSGLRAASFGRHGSWVSRRPFFPSEDPSRVWSPEPTEFYMRSHHAFHLLCSVPARSLPPARQLKLHSLNRHTVPTHCRSPRGLAARVCTHTSVRGHACSLAHTQHTRTHGPHAHTQHCILQKRKPIVY